MSCICFKYLKLFGSCPAWSPGHPPGECSICDFSQPLERCYADYLPYNDQKIIITKEVMNLDVLYYFEG